MLSGFEKVKKRYKRRMLIYSIAGGVLFGLAVTGILLIALKLSAVVLGWYLYLVIGVCAAAACAAALYFILKPNDLKLARKLDSTYSLEEKVRTRVEFETDDSPVAALQRQTTDETLDNLPKKRPSALNIVVQAAAVVAALALFISGIVVPQKRIAVIEDPPYTVDATKLELLEQLTDNIQNDSAMDADLQAAYMEELNALYANLNSEDLSETIVADYVQDSMYNISDITIAANTYDDVARVLSKSGDDVEYIAQAIRSAAKSSGSDGANIDLSSYDNLGTAAQSKISTLVTGYMSDAGDALTAVIEGLADDTVLDTLDPYISAFEAVLTDSSLADCYDALITDGGLTFGAQRTGKATSGDDLYDEIYDLYVAVDTAYTAFYNYVNGITGGTLFTSAANVQNYIIYNGTETSRNYVYVFVRDSGSALQVQAYTYLSDAYIRYTLGAIFGVTVVGNTADDGESDDSSGGDGDPGSGGSGGTGETIYPGDDKIYNPDTWEYSYYYEMLSSGYLAQLYELLDSDDISDEVKNYIRAYISELL